MYRAIIYDVAESQVFNDQFEVPGLEILPEFSIEEVRELTDKAFDTLAMYLVGEEDSVIPAIAAVGEGVMKFIERKIKGTKNEDKLAEISAKTGSFFLQCFSLIGLFEVIIESGEGKCINIDIPSIARMWGAGEKYSAIKPSLLPSLVNISQLVRGKNGVVLSYETTPIAIEMANKLFNRGWLINTNILMVALKHFKEESRVFKDYYKSSNPIARDSKKSLCSSIIDLAIEFQSKVFYHKYFFDFRGRVYCATGFLNEQGNDLAKAMLLLADGKPLGKHGEKWIKHTLASTWAGKTDYGVKSDKLSLSQRVKWANEHMGVFLNYANNPDEFTGWMDADAPWQFLAACIEMALIQQWRASGNEVEDFVSRLICFVDGSCNGSQHLAALTRDEETAVHVNLCSNNPVQDLYKYISEFVWDKINKMEVEDEQRLIDVITSISLIRKNILQSDDRGLTKSLYEELKHLKVKYGNEVKLAAPIYWRSITDPNERRKLVKR